MGKSKGVGGYEIWYANDKKLKKEENNGCKGKFKSYNN